MASKCGVMVTTLLFMAYPQNVIGVGSDVLNTSSSPWIGGLDMVNDFMPDESVSSTGNDIGGAITALPIDECERIRSTNVTLWFLMNMESNITTGSPIRCLEHAPVLTYASAIRSAVLTAMAILSFFGNIATMISIRRSRTEKRMYKHSWNAVYALIFHLSLADLLVTLFCITGEAAWSYTVAWQAGNIVCKIFKFLQMFSLYLSTFVLVLIGVDRFVVVRYPMKSLSTAKRLNKLIVLVWILSLILSIPQVGLTN
ncbi:gonadotropin-releasing hormone receptor-like [Anabrus simplex]|uniref:gonadotropin-releasing hormone receptor-like n=1 Tax=Anabrus simplex TaxID=316456 RepID=UPI0035A2E531